MARYVKKARDFLPSAVTDRDFKIDANQENCIVLSSTSTLTKTISVSDDIQENIIVTENDATLHDNANIENNNQHKSLD